MFNLLFKLQIDSRYHRSAFLPGPIWLSPADTEKVTCAIKSKWHARNSKGLTAERNYFVLNQGHIRYGETIDHRPPIGTGSMKSVFRLVLNLCMKEACLYWFEHTVEAMLKPSSYYKEGRWHLFETHSLLLNSLVSE